MRTNNLKETTTKPTWEEGANAYHKGLTLAANPYKEGTPDFESWKASFIDSKRAGMSYDLWEMSIVDRIVYLLNMTAGDAQGLVEAQPFIMSKSWAEDMSIEDTADLIIKQLN